MATLTSSGITVSRLPGIGNGTMVTYVGTPNVCTYWEVVGVVATVEGSPVGSLVHKILVTNADGVAVNQYISSTTPSDAGKTERIKVSERTP